jgi:hypothetical protein
MDIKSVLMIRLKRILRKIEKKMIWQTTLRNSDRLRLEFMDKSFQNSRLLLRNRNGGGQQMDSKTTQITSLISYYNRRESSGLKTKIYEFQIP